MMGKIIGGLVAVLIVIILGNIILPVPRAAIEVAAEPIGLGPITNALFTSIILSIIILVGAFVVGRNLKEVPGGLQNIVEFILEALGGLVKDIAPKEWVSTFFPIVVTIFIYLLFANLFSLLTPFLGSFGVVHATDHGGVPVEEITFITGSPETLTPLHEGGEGEEPTEGEVGEHEQQALIVPIFRAPSSDLNLTFALALMTMVLVQVFGLRARGIAYIGNFIRLDGFAKKGFGMGLIDFIVGILEAVSEVAKIISFSFRLFGNVFAGEVLLIVISSLVSLGVLLIIFGLEIFVGIIQAFVFFILALVFFSVATQHHGEEH